MHSVLVLLIKNKNDDLCDTNNYRVIALSKSFTKIFESVFMQHISVHDDSDKYQFGFNAGLSAMHCINAVKNAINNYTSRGSHVFSCFVDFTKAFDRVNYWKLFDMLLDDEVPVEIVFLLAYWYNHQQVWVRW